MRLMFTLSAAILTFCAASANAANDPQAITRDGAAALVGEIVRPVNGQIARYSHGVCPVVIGVNEEFGSRVAQRIRSVAGAAGAPVAAEGCTGNLMVVFTNDPATFFKSVEVDHPSWVKGLSRYSRKQMASTGNPIVAWHQTSTRDAEDQPVGYDASASQPIATIRVRGTSFVRPVTRQAIENAFVLVSLNAVNGRPIYQIVDNIALRALTPIDDPKSPSVPTVLTAFQHEPTRAPAMMTAADKAFLQAIYSGHGVETAVAERQKLAQAMSSSPSG
jgi:hypothetical protein